MGREHVTGDVRLVLLVGQNFRFAQAVADRHHGMEHGRVVDTAPSSEFGGSMGRLHAYLGV
jgi:branched-chain amino acid transport system ATP-binding protein